MSRFLRPSTVFVALSVLTSCSRVERLLEKRAAPLPSAPPTASAREIPRAPPEPAQPAPAPRGYVRMQVGGVTPTDRGNALLLVDPESHRAIPIFIGDSEALSIQLRLQKRHFQRPLTHDLLDAMVRRLDAKIESVRVDKLEDDVFYGTVVVLRSGKRLEFDARSSDAVALAIGNDVPIQVAREVIDAAGIDLDELHPLPSDAGPPAAAEPPRSSVTL